MSSSTLSGGAPRSPQSTNSYSNSAFSSDEIPTAIPQRPPRLNRSRAESTSSPTMSGAQYYQHYHPSQQQQQQQYDQYVALTPRPTPNTYSQAYSSQPTSPSSFILPPSAFTPTREEHIRSGSISYHPANGYAGTRSNPIQIPIGSHSTYTTPGMSPGMNGGSAGLTMASMPPLSLPESFLEEQSDYAEYYSDVGFASGPLTIQPRRSIHQPTRDSMLGPAVLHSHQSSAVFLPSPRLTPTLAPLAGEFSSMSLGKSAFF
jgi:hypothetical protein